MPELTEKLKKLERELQERRLKKEKEAECGLMPINEYGRIEVKSIEKTLDSLYSLFPELKDAKKFRNWHYPK
ncbi:MAG: hypothetical protein AABW58_04115 [Nanoarchaeota archaeon]